VATSLHPWDDPRIFYKQCYSLNKYYQVTLIAVVDKKSFQKDSIQVIGLIKPNSIIHRLKNALTILRELFNGKYSVMHFHDPELLWVGFIAKLFNKKVIFDIHEDIVGVVQIRNWIPKIFKNLLGYLILNIEKYAQIYFDGIILSENSYLKYFKKNNNTITVQNFVEINYKKYVKDTLIHPTIIYIGAVMYSRGIIDLVKSTIELQKEDSTIKLIIIGRIPDQDFKNKLYKLRESAPVPNNIEYLGHINFLKLKIYISKASIGIIPLHPNENYIFSYPTKIFDYMNWGLPYVYSDIPYWVKTFGTESGGLYYEACNSSDLTNKIKKIIYDEKLWKKLSKDCRKSIMNYDWNLEEFKLLRLYRNIFDNE